MDYNLQENQLKVKEHNNRIRLLQTDERYSLYTDIIPEYQEVICWGFDFQVLQDSNSVKNGVDQVKIALFNGLQAIACSKDKTLTYRSFIIWLGEYNKKNRYFCVAVPQHITFMVTKVLYEYLEKLEGFSFFDRGTIPDFPLVPLYRYDYEIIIEYTTKQYLIGKMKVEEEFGIGTCVLYKQIAVCH